MNRPSTDGFDASRFTLKRKTLILLGRESEYKSLPAVPPLLASPSACYRRERCWLSRTRNVRVTTMTTHPSVAVAQRTDDFRHRSSGVNATRLALKRVAAHALFSLKGSARTLSVGAFRMWIMRDCKRFVNNPRPRCVPLPRVAAAPVPRILG